MTNIVPLHHDKHADFKLKKGTALDHLVGQHILPVVAHEFVQAGSDVPVVFVKHAETGQFQPVAMLGLKPGENLLMKDGKWQGFYIPGIVTTYPFRLLPSQHDKNQLMLGIDIDSELVSTTEGEALFENGQPTEFLEKCKASVTAYFEHAQITQNVIKMLSDMELLVERSLAVEVNDEQISIGGLYFVDEQKLNDLEDEKFLELRKRGVLQLIYAHLVSLNQIRHLGVLKSELGKSEG